MVTTTVMDMQEWTDSRKIRESASVMLPYKMRTTSTVIEISKKAAYQLAYLNVRAEERGDAPELKFLIDAQFDLTIVPAREA